MNKYILEAVIDGKLTRFNREFKSRDDAINYIFNYYSDHYVFNLEVNDEYFIDDNKHDVAYVYDYYNRFRITKA